MKSRYDVLLNGVPLSTIHPSIFVLDVNYKHPEMNDDTFALAKRNGLRIQRRHYDSCSVSVSFEIHAYSIKERNSVCREIVAWAKNGGTLEVNDRDGQFLKCVCTQFPIVESVKNWTDPLTMVFTAYAIPFWQEKELSSIKLTGTSNSGTLSVPGDVDDALVSASIKANASLSSVSLTVNGRTLTLSGLSVSSGSTIEIAYDDNAIQSIKVGTTSLLDKRSGVDDLLAKCGESNSVSVSASASVDATFKVRGQWL